MKWLMKASWSLVAAAGLFGSAVQAQDSGLILIQGTGGEKVAAPQKSAEHAAPATAHHVQSNGMLAGMACGEQGCCPSSCNRGGIYAEAELMWLRFLRADGTRVGGSEFERSDFDFETAPRITIGFMGQGGLGGRIRYFEFDHVAPAEDADEGDQHLVDTYNIDLEVFQHVPLGHNWSIEPALGLRFNRYVEKMEDVDADDFRSIRSRSVGGLAALEARRCLGANASLFGRVRGAWLVGDRDVFNIDGDDIEDDVKLEAVTSGMLELTIGLEARRQLASGARVFVRVFGEWQNWYNFSSAFEEIDEDDFGAPSDVGFAGFGFSVGITR